MKLFLRKSILVIPPRCLTNISTMVEERSVLTVQKEASLWRLMISSAMVMLPVLTHGTVSAFLTIALPKLQKPNPTGIVIDLYQVSWLGKTAEDEESQYQPFQ